MEREVLFRGKSIDDEKWRYGSVIKFGSRMFIIPNEVTTEENPFSRLYLNIIERYAEVIPKTLGQFSGREIKGQKLFEGDFFKVGNTLKVVKFFNMSFCICNVSDLENEHTKKVMGNSIYQYPDENWWKMFEDEINIIGNIHE